MKRIVLVALLLAVSCASLPLKQRAVVSLSASETALEASHDAERLLCSPTANQAQPITHCDGAQAATIGLTDAKHQQLARLYSTAFAAEIVAATALKAWQAGDPPPVTIGDYRKDLDAILVLIGTTIPASQPTVTKIQAAADAAASVAILIGVK